MTDQVTVPREQLRQVLETLRYVEHCTYVNEYTGDYGLLDNYDSGRVVQSITALRAALEQHKQEPFGYYFRDDPRKFAMPGAGFSLGPTPPSDAEACIPLYAAPQPVQEKRND